MYAARKTCPPPSFPTVPDGSILALDTGRLVENVSDHRKHESDGFPTARLGAPGEKRAGKRKANKKKMNKGKKKNETINSIIWISCVMYIEEITSHPI